MYIVLLMSYLHCQNINVPSSNDCYFSTWVAKGQVQKHKQVRKEMDLLVCVVDRKKYFIYNDIGLCLS